MLYCIENITIPVLIICVCKIIILKTRGCDLYNIAFKNYSIIKHTSGHFINYNNCTIINIIFFIFVF